MARTRRVSKTAFTTAGVLVVAALVWWTIAVPWLVRYPTDVDASPEYAGTFSLMVNPATFEPMPEPMTLPMTVERHVEADGGESGADRVLLRETIHQEVGDLLDLTFENAYVMDRRSLKNVADDRAWAFWPSNAANRAGAYRLNLPFGTDADGSYHVYKNEIDSTYRMDGTGAVVEREGLELSEYTATLTDAQVTPAFLTALRRAAPIPETMTLDQLAPHLAAAGLEVAGSTAVPLEYVLSFEGRALVERTTGAEVVVGATESLGVRPVLGAGVDVPTIPVFTYEYDQTDESVADIAAEVGDQRRMVLLVEKWVPTALLLLVVLATVIGVAEWPFPGRRRRPATVPSPVRASGR